MKNIFGNYTLVAIDKNNQERVLMTAPIFEIDKATREFENKEELIAYLNTKDIKDIKDIRIKRIVRGKIRYTHVLYENDWEIPTNTDGLSAYIKQKKLNFFSRLLIPLYLLDYQRYISYRNLYVILNKEEVVEHPKIKRKVK